MTAVKGFKNSSLGKIEMLPATHTHSIDQVTGLQEALDAIPSGVGSAGGSTSAVVPYGSGNTVNIAYSFGEYVILNPNGQVLSSIDDEQQNVFIPIDILFDGDHYVGYYWHNGDTQRIFVEGLVFEHDVTTWGKASVGLLSKYVPCWKKVGTSLSATADLYDRGKIITFQPNVDPDITAGDSIRVIRESDGYVYNGVALFVSSPSPSVFVLVSNNYIPIASSAYTVCVLKGVNAYPRTDTPTENSRALMTSGGVYTALAALEARIEALEGDSQE